MSAGSSQSLAIDVDNMLYAWGADSSGQLGNYGNTSRSFIKLGAFPLVQNSPIQIGTSSWKQASAGVEHTAAIRSDDLLFIWGTNTNGKLGDGTNESRSSPVQLGTSSWTAISAGAQHTVGITK